MMARAYVRPARLTITCIYNSSITATSRADLRGRSPDAVADPPEGARAGPAARPREPLRLRRLRRQPDREPGRAPRRGGEDRAAGDRRQPEGALGADRRDDRRPH